MINDVLVKPLDGVTPGSDTPAAIRARPGGAAANQAAWMAHLGAAVTFAGRVGSRDEAYHRRELTRVGVRAHLAVDPEADTGSIVIMVASDGERTMFTDRAANHRLQIQDLPARLLDDADVLHLTGYTFFEPPLLEVARWLLGQARSRGLAVTVDPGSAAFLARLEPGAFLRWTDGAAVCFPNRDEAAVLVGAADPATMATRLTRHYGVVALKLGAAGCMLAMPGQAPVQVAAHPARARDTTGAGDAFCGAFMSRWLAAGTLAGAPDPRCADPRCADPQCADPRCADPRCADLRCADPQAEDRQIADLTSAAEFAVRVAASVVTRFGARPTAPR